MKRQQQKGIVLVIALVLMVVLTLFVLSSTRLATANLRIVGNVQAKKLVEATAQQAVEQVLSSVTSFEPFPAAAITITPPAGMAITVSVRDCVRAAPAPGFSATAPVAFEDTYWNVSVTVTDSITGAGTVVNQGVRIRLIAGRCP